MNLNFCLDKIIFFYIKKCVTISRRLNFFKLYNLIISTRENKHKNFKKILLDIKIYFLFSSFGFFIKFDEK